MMVDLEVHFALADQTFCCGGTHVRSPSDCAEINAQIAQNQVVASRRVSEKPIVRRQSEGLGIVVLGDGSRPTP